LFGVGLEVVFVALLVDIFEVALDRRHRKGDRPVQPEKAPTPWAEGPISSTRGCSRSNCGGKNSGN
jgi:hypothetical protein